jgi:hypothetical protein
MTAQSGSHPTGSLGIVIEEAKPKAARYKVNRNGDRRTLDGAIYKLLSLKYRP